MNPSSCFNAPRRPDALIRCILGVFGLMAVTASGQTLKSIGVPAYHPGLQNNENSPWNFTGFDKISTDGRIMVGDHGIYGGNLAWKWENGAFTYFSQNYESVRMSADGRTIVLQRTWTSEPYRVYFNGALTETYSGRTLMDVTGDGSKFLSWRQDWSVPSNSAVELGNSSGWQLLPGPPEDGEINSVVRFLVSGNGQVAVGHDTDDAYRYFNGSAHRLSRQAHEHDGSSAWGISYDGRTIVGLATRGYGPEADGTRHRYAVRWVDGVEDILETPADWTRPYANSVSDDGTIIVGAYTDPDGYSQAFIWTEQTGCVRLLDYLAQTHGIDTQFWWLNSANLISGDGKVIVGIGWEPGGENIVWRFNKGTPLEFALNPSKSIYEPGETFTAKIKVRDAIDRPATYTFPEGVVVETREEPRLLIREPELDRFELSPADPVMELEVPMEAAIDEATQRPRLGATTVRTKVRRTDEAGRVMDFTAEIPLIISPLESEVTVTPAKQLLNQTPESKWGSRAKALNDALRAAGGAAYPNPVEIELKVRNMGEDTVQTVNLPGAVDALSFITSTDLENPGVPLTPVRFYAPDGSQIDLTDPNADPTVESVTLAPGQEITFAWVFNAFDADPDPGSDDGAKLEFEALVIGGLDGQEVRVLGTEEFEVIDRPLLEWGIRPKEGRTAYRSGQVVRIDGYLENISTRDDKPPVDLRVRLYQMPAGNLGGGFMFDPAKPDTSKVRDITIFELPAEGPGRILNLSAIMRSVATLENSEGRVRYGVQVWTVRPNPDDPGTEEVEEVFSQAILKEEWTERFKVTFSADREVYTAQEECYRLRNVVPELSALMPFFCGMEQGAVVEFTEGFIGLTQFLINSAYLTKDAGIGSAVWAMHNFKLSWDAVWGDPAARTALVQEAYVQYETLVNLGVMAGEGVANAPMAIEAFELKMIESMAQFFHSVENGDIDELEFAVGKFLGSNPDLLLEPLVVARNYQRMVRASTEIAGDVVDHSIRTAVRAENARKASSKSQRLAEARATGKAQDAALLPGDILDERDLLDIYGITPEQMERLQEIAKKFKITVTFRSRNPLSVKLISEGFWPKPQALKHKTVNQIDIDFLGYRPEAKASLEMVEPPAGLLGPDGRALTGTNLETAIKNEIERHRAKIGNNKVLEREVEERMAQRADEWNKLFLDKVNQVPGPNGQLEQKITTAFEAELQYLPDRRDKIEQVGAKEKRTVTYEPIPGREPRTWVMKMTGPNGAPPAGITGDVDFLGIFDETNNMIRDDQMRREIYTHLEQALDMQHGESFTFFLQKARKEYLEECSLGADGAAAMVAISGAGDAVPRAAYFVDNLSIIDGPGTGLGRFLGNHKWLPKRAKTKLSILDYWLRPGQAKEIRRADPTGEFVLLDGIHINSMPDLDFVNAIVTETLAERLERYFSSLEFWAPLFLRKSFGLEDSGIVFSENADASLIQAVQDGENEILRIWDPIAGWQEIAPQDALLLGGPGMLEMKPMTLLPYGAEQGATRMEITPLEQFAMTGDFFDPGDQVVINPGMPNQEIRTVSALGSLIFSSGFRHSHDSGEMVASLGPDTTDRDADGLTGLEEIQIGTDPDVTDSDGDGMSDGLEVSNGLNPLDPGSNFRITTAEIDPIGGSVTLTWNSQQGRQYAVEASATLGDDWEELTRFTAPVPGLQSVTVPMPESGRPKMFFRLKLLPFP